MPLQLCLAEHRKQEVLVEPSMVILARGVYLATSSFTLRTTAWREVSRSCGCHPADGGAVLSCSLMEKTLPLANT